MLLSLLASVLPPTHTGPRCLSCCMSGKELLTAGCRRCKGGHPRCSQASLRSAFATPGGQSVSCGRCNQRSWLYRIRPSVTHEPFHPLDFASEVFSGDFARALVTPNQLRWRPFSVPSDLVDFVRGLFTICGAGRRARDTVAPDMRVLRAGLCEQGLWPASSPECGVVTARPRCAGPSQHAQGLGVSPCAAAEVTSCSASRRALPCLLCRAAGWFSGRLFWPRRLYLSKSTGHQGFFNNNNI